ncbi:hypothetical protein F5Y18DRAFT_397515 [Xylariaceae sp. FL1019]|nr:hypothetical protein F5Y18DRAFT_397515 [Xylariaceae sp. FL1019]
MLFKKRMSAIFKMRQISIFFLVLGQAQLRTYVFWIQHYAHNSVMFIGGSSRWWLIAAFVIRLPVDRSKDCLCRVLTQPSRH